MLLHCSLTYWKSVLLLRNRALIIIIFACMSTAYHYVHVSIRVLLAVNEFSLGCKSRSQYIYQADFMCALVCMSFNDTVSANRVRTINESTNSLQRSAQLWWDSIYQADQIPWGLYSKWHMAAHEDNSEYFAPHINFREDSMVCPMPDGVPNARCCTIKGIPR